MLTVAVAACAKIANIPSYALDDGGTTPAIDASVGSGSGSACEPWGSAGCVTALVAGYHRTCAIAGGNLYCWGNTPGDGGSAANTPQPIAKGVEIVSASTDTVAPTGVGVTCFASAGQLQCWGDGGDAQQEGNTSTVVPAILATPIAPTQIGVGADHVCASTITSVSCWGATDFNQVGSNYFDAAPCETGACSATPSQVYLDTTIDQIAAGLSHTCAHDATGAVSCWGLDGDGQLGNGMTGSGYADDALSKIFTTADNIVQISAGNTTTCAVVSGGAWACWGAGGTGQLGDGEMHDADTPMFTATETFTAISVGTSSVCGLTVTGEVDCWGDNSTGVSGSSFVDMQENAPKPKGITNAKLIAVGNDHACAALTTGDIECWGEAYEGALGTGTAMYASCPNTSSSVQCTATPQLVLSPASPF
ncbi:MAG TPA: hypothetical protein VH143_32025 [Kofleriaceae bacterium]|nr:hypothetical protein [Kofleriaceae bacterium]